MDSILGPTICPLRARARGLSRALASAVLGMPAFAGAYDDMGQLIRCATGRPHCLSAGSNALRNIA